ncbi:MAG: TetR/AcrR family transcriptional regulator [Bacteroidaceae bacterium]|nr:TetR/AcrR family transcriptional regulator [Bacteroidaceae bacterium]
MKTSRTKELFVNVARQLFAQNGVENTTMNDIALASGKGRRTLYTYFKNKEDVYFAVIESELDMLTKMMRKVAAKNTAPDEKILELIYTHLDTIKDVVHRNGTLTAEFFRDIWRVERIRMRFNYNETAIFREVLAEGIQKGVFDIDNVDIYANILHCCVKGIEVNYIRGRIGKGLDRQTVKHYVRRIVFGALNKIH